MIEPVARYWLPSAWPKVNNCYSRAQPWAQPHLGSASQPSQAKPQMTYSESVIQAADAEGFLSDRDISKILTQHSASWDDYSEWLGKRNSQTPLMAESVLAFLGY